MRATKVFVGLILTVLLSAFTLAAQPETPVEEYAARRAHLLKEVGGPVVIFGYEQTDLTEFLPFQQEPNFFYLSGHEEPRAALLLVPQTDRAKAAGLPAEILFTPKQNRRSVVFDGLSVFPGTEGVEERTGFATVEPVEELQGVLEKTARVFPVLHTLLPARPRAEVDSLHAQRWRDWLQTELPGVELANMRGLINSMRVIKSATEIKAERWTNQVTREGHLAAMRSIRPGMIEHELAAAMEYEFRRKGCRPGYGSIVGAGPNSVILHYNVVNRKMEAGEVVVLDVAASCGNYTSDITRTLPVSGKFTKRQRQIYEIVLGAQQAAIAAVKPGMMLGGRGEESLNRIAREYIIARGKEIGEDLAPYILHGLGHYVGLQVHDVGSYGRPLEAGMMITIEPGIYIAKENLGVRIEDVILVTEDGYEVISNDIPKTVKDVEAVIAYK
jgi:Xaa-Pro aminopeptidase